MRVGNLTLSSNLPIATSSAIGRLLDSGFYRRQSQPDSGGWLKARDIQQYAPRTKKTIWESPKLITAEQARSWMREAEALGKGVTKGTGVHLEFSAICFEQQRFAIAQSESPKNVGSCSTLSIYESTGESFTVKVGAQTLHLQGEHLGINHQVAKLLEDARGGYRANVSQKLRDAAHKLQAQQKAIYCQYTVLIEPFRLVHETSLPSALQAIEAMQQKALQLRQEIVTAYEEEFTAFLSWAHDVLRQANLELSAIEAALTQYADAYPTQEDFQECLQVVVEGPVKIPSLIEDAKVRAEETKKQADAEATKIEREKLALLRRSQEQLQQTLVSTLYDAQTRSRDEAYGKLAELLESFAISGQDTTQRTGQKWQTLQQRLQVLSDFDPNLEPIVQRTGQIQSLLLSSNPNLNEVQGLMDEFRELLKQRLKRDSSGTGAAQLAKALAFDAEYSDLLKELDAITSNPDPDALNQIKGKLSLMESILSVRAKSLIEKQRLAENAVRQKLGLAPVPLQSNISNIFVQSVDNGKKSEQESKKKRKNKLPEVYDEEAGF